MDTSDLIVSSSSAVFSFSSWQFVRFQQLRKEHKLFAMLEEQHDVAPGPGEGGGCAVFGRFLAENLIVIPSPSNESHHTAVPNEYGNTVFSQRLEIEGSLNRD